MFKRCDEQEKYINALTNRKDLTPPCQACDGTNINISGTTVSDSSMSSVFVYSNPSVGVA